MVRTILAELKEYKKPSILTPLFMVLEVLCETVIPLLMASVVDKGILGGEVVDGVATGDMKHIILAGGLMVLVAFVALTAGILSGRFGAIASAGLAKNLRLALFKRIQGFSFANIDKYSTPGLVTRLTTDVTNVQNAYMMILRMCVRAPIMMITAMLMAFAISPKLASIYLVAVVFLGICLAVIISKATKYFTDTFKKYDDLNESVQENVSAIRVVKAFVREDYEREKFFKASNNIRNLLVRAENIVALNGPLMQITVYGCVLFISWFGAKEIVGGTLTTGNLSALLTYCMNILMSLMILSFIFVMVTMSTASVKRIAEVLTEESTLKNPENPVMTVKDGSVRFDHVTFRYNPSSEKPNLDDINLSIASGETIGILGGTGSAKTTLISLISRLYDASEGTVYVGGVDVKQYDMELLRNEVAVVLQKNVLFSGTILDNLRWGKEDATLEECREVCRMACADEFIDRMEQGYDTKVEQGGNNLSGGQKQRLCIARALLKKPKILILDDSTSAVDTATDAKIREAFAAYIPSTTKIIIAQRVSSLMHADHILVLMDGKINGWGTHEELLANNEIYRDIYESQTGGARDFDA